MLSDFGISRLVEDGVTITGTNAFNSSVNWLAIELVTPSDTAGSVASNGLHTMKSDIWAMGMVFYVGDFVNSPKIITEYHLRNC